MYTLVHISLSFYYPRIDAMVLSLEALLHLETFEAMLVACKDGIDDRGSPWR